MQSSERFFARLARRSTQIAGQRCRLFAVLPCESCSCYSRVPWFSPGFRRDGPSVAAQFQGVQKRGPRGLPGRYLVNGIPLEPWLRTSLWRTFGGRDAVVYDHADAIRTDHQGSSMDIGGAIAACLSREVALRASASYSGNIDSENQESLPGSIGLPIGWRSDAGPTDRTARTCPPRCASDGALASSGTPWLRKVCQATGLNHLTLAVAELPRSIAFYQGALSGRPKARWARVRTCRLASCGCACH